MKFVLWKEKSLDFGRKDYKIFGLHDRALDSRWIMLYKEG